MGTFDTAFKKKGSGKLKWIECIAKNEKEATDKARKYISENYPLRGYVIYAGPLKAN